MDQWKALAGDDIPTRLFSAGLRNGYYWLTRSGAVVIGACRRPFFCKRCVMVVVEEEVCGRSGCCGVGDGKVKRAASDQKV